MLILKLVALVVAFTCVMDITGLLITTGLSHLFLAGLVRWLAAEAPRTQLETASHITAVGLTGIYSFFGHKYFTYMEGVRGEFMKIFQRLKLQREQKH